MPYIFALIGIMAIVVGVRNTQDNLFGLLKGDFTGPNNFFVWVISILIVGAFGYIKPIKPITNAILVLVIISMIISNKGLFTKLHILPAIKNTANSSTFPQLPTLPKIPQIGSTNE